LKGFFGVILIFAVMIFRQIGENATIESIKKAGHLVQLERPCVYNRRLKKFLASIHSEDKIKMLH